ncbi:MAG: M28 family peptidase [Candidatus Zixiibacteriota bacterium]|nr:MAG: M28 family peptidase [candidate division Zixibacteria bacterium]
MKSLSGIIFTTSLLLTLFSVMGKTQEYDTADSWNFSSRILTNEAIEEMIDSVSAERILAGVDTLVGFYTRHTNSDTLSSSTGLGAARRWVYDQFEAYAVDSATYELQPGYFTFNATVCGIYGEHRNMLATLPGTATPNRYFLTMGHIDSRTNDVCDASSFAPSANDDGSGTAIAMEIARIMSRYPFESTVIVMVVTGEDQGLYGSTAYAQWAQSQSLDIGAVITNDVVGNIEGCENPACPPGEPVIVDSLSARHFSGTPETGISRQLSRYMKLKAMEYLQGFTVNLIPALDRPGRSGDHVPFYNRGYAGVRFTEAHENGDGSGNNGRQHNAHDTLSYYNTNAGYMANIARINIAGIASLALAPAPPGYLQAVNAGNGTSVILTWPYIQTEPDFAGYRIAVRPQGELFYSDVIDAGDVSQFVLDSLTEGQLVYLSISAYDTDDNESVFSEEISFTPSSIPAVPAGFETESRQTGIQLTWIPNTELDIDCYNVFRIPPGQTNPHLIQIVHHPASSYFDNTVQPHNLYTYNITAVDSLEQESRFSDSRYGQLATHDLGVLLIDGTLDGSGGPLQPTDEEVDDYYAAIVDGFNIGGNWDVADSTLVDVFIQDAHFAPFSAVFYHSDRVNAPHVQDTTALKKYLDNGGNLLLSGWNLAGSFGGVVTEFSTFPQGSFFREYLKTDSLGVSQPANQDFISATSLMPSAYPDLTIDSVKVPIFDHRMFKMDAFLSPLVDEPVTERLYTYNSSFGGSFRLHGEPVGFRHLGNEIKIIVFDVPLYFMNQQQATTAAGQALGDLGEEYVGVVEEHQTDLPQSIGYFQSYPNPFNPSATIDYEIVKKSNVRIAVYNLLGQEIEVLKDGVQEPGFYRISWNAQNCPSGIYFCRIKASDISEVIRMVLLR